MVADDLADVDLLAELRTRGYLRLKLAPTTTKKLRDAYNAAQIFFQGCKEDKNTAKLPMDAGYRSFGAEYAIRPDSPDRFESFSYCPQVSHAAARLRDAKASVFYEKLQVLFSATEPIAESVAVSLASSLAGQAVAAKLLGGLKRWSVLQMNCSVQNDDSSSLATEVHEDGCFLTLMANTGPGLEFIKEDQIEPIDLGADEIIAIPGEILWLLSAGDINPLYHRVRDPKPGRLAMLFFADLEPALCTPWSDSDVNRGVDIGGRVLTNPARNGLQLRLLAEGA